ncbi:unnamed protein product [Lathyrus sativus]|nr:unnamed protein product [Lathyrus sativus]
MEQKIEYEWRPSYYQTYLKIGHDCANKKNNGKKLQQTKVWKPAANKQIVEEIKEDTLPKPNEEEYNKDKVDEEESLQKETATDWTLVTSSRVDKGKRVMIETSKNSFVPYQNAFTPLRNGECPREETSHDQ